LKRRTILQMAMAAPVVSAFGLPRPALAQAPHGDWSKILEAARAEGEVIVWGTTGDERRAFWKEAFEKAYPGIRVNLFGAPSLGQRDNRFLQELGSKIVKLDVMIGGSGGATGRLKPQGALQPLKPFLTEDTLDPKHWYEGKPIWGDKEQQYLLVSDVPTYAPVALHPSVPQGAIANWEDLLDPKYDKKIVVTDPRQAGPGFALGLFMYYDPNLGPDFVKALYKGGRVVFSQDERQNVEWVDSGRVQICLIPRTYEVEQMQALGSKIYLLADLKAKGVPQTSIAGSDGALFLPNIELPHPSATKVYVNWFYSKDGQQAMVDNIRTVSNRVDVDHSKILDHYKRKPGVRYTIMNDERYTVPESVKTMREAVDAAVNM
jgi:ABC-type Fe3+ transport system substrate-binding protein